MSAETAIAAALAEIGKLGDQLRQEAHAATGIVPEIVKPVVQTAEDEIKDTPSYQDLMATIANLKAEMNDLKTRGQAAFSQLANQAAVDFASGGDPVDHTLHLEDGSVVQATGLSTHIASPDGSVKRVIAAYPSTTTANR